MEWVSAVPIELILLIIFSLWLVLHYVTRWRSERARALSAEDQKMLAELSQSARKMEARIATLETILDAEVPGWRGRI